MEDISVDADIKKLKHGVHVVTGGPGRVTDMIKQRAISTKAIRLWILDECDETISQASVKQKIHELYRFLSRKHFQVVLITDTLPGEILEMEKEFMKEYVRILVKRD
ncbi:RNA helicase [Sarracenia purpurea var. burkii]